MKISILLQALTARFETDMARARKRLGREMKQMQRDAAKIGRRVGIAIAGAAIATAAIFRAHAKSIDALAKSADALGVSTENLQTLRTMAELTGVDIGKFDKALAKMQKTIGEVARRGGDMALAITDMGLSVEEVMSLPADQQFEVVAKALGSIENASVRASIANDLFGRDAQKLLKLTDQLAKQGLGPMRQELDEMGLLITRTEAAGVERMNDSMLLAKEAASALAQRYTIALAPGIAAIAEEFTEAAKETGGFKDAAFNAAEATIRAFAFVIDSIDSIGDGFEKMANRGIIAFERLVQQAPKLPFTLPIAAVNKDFRDRLQEELRFSESVIAQAYARIAEIQEEADPSEAILARLARIREELADAGDDIQNRAGASGGGGFKVIDPEEEKRLAKISSMLSDMLQEVTAFGATSEDQALLKLVALGATEAEIMQARQIMDELRILGEEEEAREESARRRNELESEYASIVQSLRTPIEEHADAVQRIVELYAAGVIKNAEEYERVLARMNERFLESQNETEKMDQFAISAARNMQSAFADFLFDPFDEGVEGMLESFSRILRRMAAEAAAAKILESLANSFGGGEGGGFWASFFSSFGGGRARGGPVSANRPYLVGEEGPEIVVPRVSGTVVPNGQIAGGGNITNNFIMPPQPAPKTESQLAYEVQQRQRIAMARNR